MTWQAGSDLDGRYRLEAKIGEGGMGEVWRARHLALDSDVAIKFLGTQLANNEEVRQRFRAEAQITAKLRSRNAVQVFDFGVSDGEPYLVMELLHGETLSRRIEREGRLAPATTVLFLRDAARALSKAHASGIVHRDFKPDNVFLTDIDGQVEVKVVDFGIAKMIGTLEATLPVPVDLSQLTDKRHLTRTGRMVGTPHYMGPEQVRMDADIGAAADIWALGVVAYECLTGRCPFEGDNVLELFTNIQLYNWMPATRIVPSLPASFDDWFRKVCAPEPADRFADANLAVDALAVALHLDMPREMHSDGSRLRSDSISDGHMPIIRYATPSTENLLEGAGDPVFSKATLLNASLPVRQKPSRRSWVIAAASCLLLALVGVARLPRQGHPNVGTPSTNKAHERERDTLFTTGTDAATPLATDPSADGPSASTPPLSRPDRLGASASADAGVAASGTGGPSHRHAKGEHEPTALSPGGGTLPPAQASPTPPPPPPPAVTPATPPTTTPFKNPALGF
jgi:serine/threonine protein kinase